MLSKNTYQEGWYRLIYESDNLPPIRVWLTPKEAYNLLHTPRRKQGMLQSSMAWRLGFSAWAFEDTSEGNSGL